MRVSELFALTAAIFICGSSGNFAAADQSGPLQVMPKAAKAKILMTKNGFYELISTDEDFISQENHDQPQIVELSNKSLQMCDFGHSDYYKPTGQRDAKETFKDVTRALNFKSVLASSDRNKQPYKIVAEWMIQGKLALCAGFPIPHAGLSREQNITAIAEKTSAGNLVVVVPPLDEPSGADLTKQGEAISWVFNAAYWLGLSAGQSYVGFTIANASDAGFCLGEDPLTCGQSAIGYPSLIWQVETHQDGEMHRLLQGDRFIFPKPRFNRHIAP